MRKISISVVSLVGMAGLAFAQGTQDQPKPPQQPQEQQPPEQQPPSAPEQTARAGEPSRPGAATEPKTGTTAQPAKKEMPKPPPQIAEMMKTMGARMRCTGMAMGGPEMNTEMKITGNVTSKVDLDGWYIRSVMNATMGEGRNAMKLKMESLSTYDATAQKWRGASAMNDGGFMVSTSEGLREGKMESTSETWGPMGAGRFREQVDATDPKAGIKMLGEMSKDDGKTWNKVYEMTCKK